ncbi:PREDICTED: polyphenol oxidase E, chloroplastic-like [Nicotiana attenuata]|uniref:catechol oxidase n=1 Tax=Nicotiana attenuata TaxID=49451 RepID=A0A1J6JLI9_NICAT|nr:PREDICTED: polyphenol oxidase E, chloroplastic-like [Nicotiana attenuata]XP_019242343.1 PREDICTED: polyphenol oxidase E, chloroplastic-like [Nicotiana attenuata]OIT18685.1 polyphenol oxidase e, chloroplastic [Nicotiana attenuata]OIT31975.1 polyphenol oxidase e, chloroplastic [Nicotiana attenuata]
MASSSTLPLCTTKTPFSSSTNSFFFAKPSHLFLNGKRNQSFKVSCTGEHDGNQLDAIKEGAVERRNVLLGLGGLYGAANLAPLASAAPVPPPDLKSCGPATITDGPTVSYSCCPPTPDDMDSVPYYKIPRMSKLRKRPAAQDVSEEYIAKYQLATSKMRELDKDPFDPLGFKQQANIHCAYCNDAYTMGDKKLQVHQSWLFFPFHRWYLYFYERILGSLIDDPTFALPYWNWDHPSGMRLPAMFDVEGSSLYDARRNPNVRNGTIIDLGFFGNEVKTNEIQMITNNLILMYRQMITNAPSPLLFFGEPYRFGSKPNPGQGTIENIPHTPVHIWTGTVRDTDLGNGVKSYGEDMGNFYSAGLDPVFYSHHANVDRMWNEWKALGGKRRDLTDKDWLNSEFFFYDENRDPWRVKVRDCLDSKKMGYDYEPKATPWRNFKPGKKTTPGKVNLRSVKPASKVFPLSNLDRAICFSIERPATSRSQQEKDEFEEVLTFKNLKYDDSRYIKFDVFVNADKTVNADDIDKTEYAGSYTSLPHVHGPNNATHVVEVEEFKLAITELLEDCGLEDDDIIAVTVVPKTGGEVVSIDCVLIELKAFY